MKFFFAGVFAFAALLFSSSLPAAEPSRLGYDNFIDGGFSRFPANTNLAALSTNLAGAAWRAANTNWVRVPQNSVLVVGGRQRGTSATASNTLYKFSGSRNGVFWVTNAYTATIAATGMATNIFNTPVATNLPYLYIVWDRVDNQDAVAATNDALYYIWFPSRLRD